MVKLKYQGYIFGMDNIIKSDFNSYKEFATELFKNNKRCRPNRVLPGGIVRQNLAFVILENNKIPWSWYKEKLTQTLYWNMQGGVTGAGSGHHVYFEKDIHEALCKVKDAGYTHAMLCQVGMLFTSLGSDQITDKSPIQNFYDFCKSDEFMRTHVICHPGRPATIHAQHVEINLEKWNGDSITKLGTDFKRPKENIHDDYTPPWIDTHNHPRILNFTPEQRKHKRYLYAHRDFKKNSNLVYDLLKNGIDNIAQDGSSASKIKYFFSKYKSRYYFENNERLIPSDGKKYDVIFAPSAGLFAEYLYDNFGHEGTKTIIYDYNKDFLDIKKNILEYGFVGGDVTNYANHLAGFRHDIDLKTARTPNMLSAINHNSNLLDDDTRRILQDNFIETDHEYMLWDLINDSSDHIIDIIKDKDVLFFASNIYKYIAVWMYNDYSIIKNQYINLHNTLNKYSNSYSYYGKTYHSKPSTPKEPLYENTSNKNR